MKASELQKAAERFVDLSPGNVVSPLWALAQEYAGMQIFEGVLLGYAKADDDYFVQLNDTKEAGVRQLLPGEWLDGAKTVISFFLPFSAQVRRSNRLDPEIPSSGWLHGRVEGQEFVLSVSKHLQVQLEVARARAVVPELDSRYASEGFSSNWSQRHVAFACGLGTFSLSKGMITEKGVAGRFGSLVTDLELPATPRPYSRVDEYCNRCGACARNCPAGAIDPVKGKDHERCSAYLDRIHAEYKPYYGCGKCQVRVPCENKIPG